MCTSWLCVCGIKTYLHIYYLQISFYLFVYSANFNIFGSHSIKTSSRIDYCNSIILGNSQGQLSHLQLVQDAAARLLTRTKKREN